MTAPSKLHFVFVVMGVSGSGKSTVASRLGSELHAAVLDGDYLHPRANILKMADGHPLDDADRAPWLAALNDAAFAMQRVNDLSFIVCSGLKRRYRDLLRQGNPALRFIYLKGGFDLIEARMKARAGHFFTPAMLTSQFDAFEEPGPDEADVITISIDQTPEAVAAEALHHIKRITADAPGAM